jgi:hypothetical protein
MGHSRRYDLSRRSHSAPLLLIPGRIRSQRPQDHAADPPRLWISMSRRRIAVSNFLLHFRGSLVFCF